MARVKTGATRRRRHKKILKAAKGYRLARGRHVRKARETALHAGQYAFVGRKLKKRDFRRLWIQRINAGLSQIENAPSYSSFINLLKQNRIELNRKILSELAVNDLDAFKVIVTKVYGQ
jgi:large subunit ribosomal protein L20